MDVERGGKADRKKYTGGWVVGWVRGEKMRRAKKSDRREDGRKNGTGGKKKSNK